MKSQFQPFHLQWKNYLFLSLHLPLPRCHWWRCHPHLVQFHQLHCHLQWIPLLNQNP